MNTAHTVIDPEIEPILSYALAKHHPNGPVNIGCSTHGATRWMLDTVVNCLAYALKKAGSTITVDLEKVGTGAGNARGLIIFSNTNRTTTVIPLAVMPNLIRINKRPVFVAHKDGAALVLNAIINEIELAEAAL